MAALLDQKSSNTLHLWDGVLEVASEWPDGSEATKKQDSYGKPIGKFPVKFRGNMTHLRDCPDSRSVGVPTANLFRGNKSRLFHFKGIAEETGQEDGDRRKARGGRRIYHVNITTCNNNNDEEWYLRLPTLDFWDVWSRYDGKVLIEGVVVGRGRNAQGSFIEAGWVSDVDGWGSNTGPSSKIRLTLGRRYLSANDERVEWSLSELLRAVMIDAASPRNDRPPLLLPPWQSSCLSAFNNTMSGGKRKREGDKPILPPHVGSPFRLKLQMKETSYGKTEANTLWKDQCWGCGKILSNPVTIDWSTSSYDEPITDILRGEFCEGKSECISKAFPQLIAMSAKITTILKKNGWFVQAYSEDGFWDVINQNQELRNKLTEAGWEEVDETTWNYKVQYSD